jgi:uncharacterized protein HemX
MTTAFELIVALILVLLVGAVVAIWLEIRRLNRAHEAAVEQENNHALEYSQRFTDLHTTLF